MVETILKGIDPQQKDLLLVALQKLSEQQQLNEEVLLQVAKHFNISPAKVYGVASFYSFLPLKSKGKYIIRICKSVSCDIAGKEEIVDAIRELLQVELGGTTSDGFFTLVETNCLGWCDEAPAILVNDMPYINLTKEKVAAIITELKKAQ